MKRTALIISIIILSIIQVNAFNYSLTDIEQSLIDNQDINHHSIEYLIDSCRLSRKERQKAKALLQLCYYNIRNYNYNFSELNKYRNAYDWDNPIKTEIEFTLFQTLYDTKKYNNALRQGAYLLSHLQDSTSLTPHPKIPLIEEEIGYCCRELKMPDAAIDYLWMSVAHSIMLYQEIERIGIGAYFYAHILDDIKELYLDNGKDTTEQRYILCDSILNTISANKRNDRQAIYSPFATYANTFIHPAQKIDTLTHLSKRHQFSINTRINLAKEAVKRKNNLRPPYTPIEELYSNIASLYLLEDEPDSANHYYYMAGFKTRYDSNNSKKVLNMVTQLHNIINTDTQLDKLHLYLAVTYMYKADTIIESRWGINNSNYADYVYRVQKYDLKGNMNEIDLPTIINHVLLKSRLGTRISFDLAEQCNDIIQDIADTLNIPIDELLVAFQKQYYYNTNEYIAYNINDYDSLSALLLKELENNKHFYTSQLAQPYHSTYLGNRVYSANERKTATHSRYKTFGDNIMYYATSTNYPPIVKCAYDYTLFKKQLLLYTESALYSAKSDNAKEILQNRKQLKKVQSLTNDIWEKDSLQIMIESAERQLSVLQSDSINPVDYASVTSNRICQMLDKDEVAVEFIDYPVYIDLEFQHDTAYLALILFPNDSFPKIAVLPKENELRQLYENSDSAMISNDFAQSLYRYIWKPVMPYLKSIKTIYFAPGGCLNLLPIEAALINDTISMSDNYNLIRLTSTRNIAEYKSHATFSPVSAALYGDISYTLSDSTMSEKAVQYSHLRSDRGYADKLENSKQEIDNIDRILKSKNISPQLFEQKEAVEEAFLALNGNSPSILHLSTHGFYWSNEQAQATDYYLNRRNTASNQGATAYPMIEIDPMERSGLLFAGANKALQGQFDYNDNMEDGLLTADEIAQTDLSNTQLVVLSACNTGLGDLSSEGVWGLQRAFRLAGAETMVMSLWKVDDEATALLMQYFYEELFATREPHQAMKKAQDRLKAVPRFSSPYYWASFIVVN